MNHRLAVGAPRWLRRWGRGVVLLLLASIGISSCSSVEIVRLQPDILHTPKGTEPLAALQATSMGFYFFTLGIPEADLDKSINELLIKEAKKIGADKLTALRFDVTPSHGIWFLTKLLWFRVATAWAVAVVAEPADEDLDPLDTPMDTSPPPERVPPASRPTSAPAASRPTAP